MPFTNYFDQMVMELLFSNTSYSIPGTYYVGLSTTTPTQVKGSSPYWNFTEPSGGAYARTAITNNSTNWTVVSSEPTNGWTMQNGTVIGFPTPTASWGTITYFGLFDASTSGNLIVFGGLTTSPTIGTGAAASFAVGALTITND